MLMQLLDMTITNVALSHMRVSLGATQDEIDWVLTSHIVAAAIATPVTGWLADRLGRKAFFLSSVIAFVAASASCAAGQTIADMVLLRIVQGVAGAFLVPLAQATLLDINPPARHGRAGAVRGLSHGRPDPRRVADPTIWLAVGVPDQCPGGRDRGASDPSCHAAFRRLEAPVRPGRVGAIRDWACEPSAGARSLTLCALPLLFLLQRCPARSEPPNPELPNRHAVHGGPLGTRP